MSETCLKCGAEWMHTDDGGTQYRCGSDYNHLGVIVATGRVCGFRQLEFAESELASLRSQLAAEKQRADAAWGRWEKLREELRLGIKTHSGSNIVRETFCSAYQGILELMDILDAPPAEERRPAVERPDRPPMLLARRFTGMGGIWVWMTRKEADWSYQWHGSDDCDYKSRDLLEVDRDKSEAGALALYDADISTSGDAAKREEN